MSIVRKIVLCAAVAATTLAAIPVEAGDRGHDDRWHRSQDNSDGDLLAAGIAGLVVGALVVDAINGDSEEPGYVNPYRHPRPSPDRGYVLDGSVDVDADDAHEAAYEPWFRHCQKRYRSFDGETGAFIGHGGRERFCETG